MKMEKFVILSEFLCFVLLCFVWSNILNVPLIEASQWRSLISCHVNPSLGSHCECQTLLLLLLFYFLPRKMRKWVLVFLKNKGHSEKARSSHTGYTGKNTCGWQQACLEGGLCVIWEEHGTRFPKEMSHTLLLDVTSYQGECLITLVLGVGIYTW